RVQSRKSRVESQEVNGVRIGGQGSAIGNSPHLASVAFRRVAPSPRQSSSRVDSSAAPSGLEIQMGCASPRVALRPDSVGAKRNPGLKYLTPFGVEERCDPSSHLCLLSPFTPRLSPFAVSPCRRVAVSPCRRVAVSPCRRVAPSPR